MAGSAVESGYLRRKQMLSEDDLKIYRLVAEVFNPHFPLALLLLFSLGARDSTLRDTTHTHSSLTDSHTRARAHSHTHLIAHVRTPTVKRWSNHVERCTHAISPSHPHV